MKRSEFLIDVVLVPVDMIALLLAPATAYFFRYSEYVIGVRGEGYQFPVGKYFLLVGFFIPLFIAIFAWNEMYRLSATRKISEELWKIISSVSNGMTIVIFATFFSKEFFTSRFIVLACWALSIIYISFFRIIVRGLQKYYLKRGYGVHRVVLIGDTEEAKIIEEGILKNPGLGYTIVGRLREAFDSKSVLKFVNNIRKQHGLDEIFQVSKNLPRDVLERLINYTDRKKITLKFSPNLFDTHRSNIDLRPIGGVPLVEIKDSPLEGWGKIMKRCVDICGSFFAIVLFSPILFTSAVIVKLTSKGPVFVKLKRINQGKTFPMYKFRSMYIGADKMKHRLYEYNERKDGPLFKMKDDPRITPFGKFIRKYSIDELPNFFNVLKGDMSIVGPRPHEPKEVEKYSETEKRTLKVKPGVTGLSQISGRSDLSFSEEVKLDIYYIENWSVFLDLYVIFATPFAVFQKRKAS